MAQLSNKATECSLSSIFGSHSPTLREFNPAPRIRAIFVANAPPWRGRAAKPPHSTGLGPR
jgi:hypothetical protein